MADKKILERNGDDIRKHLGKAISVAVLTPQGEDFSEAFISNDIKRNKLSNIQVKATYYGNQSWVNAYDLVAKLQSPTTDRLDIELSVLVDLLTGY
jgi:hypothetical protein